MTYTTDNETSEDVLKKVQPLIIEAECERKSSKFSKSSKRFERPLIDHCLF